jgi:plasmid stabilization system protein ParE
MNYKIILLPKAYEDIKEINKFYKKINIELAKRFNSNLKIEIKNMANNPLLFQVRYDLTFRVIKINDFPYLIHFELLQNNIIINAIYHSSRDSKLNEF